MSEREIFESVFPPAETAPVSAAEKRTYDEIVTVMRQAINRHGVERTGELADAAFVDAQIKLTGPIRTKREGPHDPVGNARINRDWRAYLKQHPGAELAPWTREYAKKHGLDAERVRNCVRRSKS